MQGVSFTAVIEASGELMSEGTYQLNSEEVVARARLIDLTRRERPQK